MQKSLGIFVSLLILTATFAAASNVIGNSLNFNADGDPVYGFENTPNAPNGSALPSNEIDFPFIDWNAKASYSNNTALGMSCVDDSGYLYGLGGRYPDVATCNRYDITTNTWTPIASMPGTNSNQYAVFWKDNTPGTVDSTCILVLGRYTYPPSNYFKTCYRWWKATNTWDTIPQFPGSAYTGNMAAVIGDSVYMVIRTTETGGDTMYIYNIRTGTWVGGLPPADRLNYYGAMCSYEGKLYQLGGWTNRQTFQIYTPGSGWVLSVNPPGNVGGRTPCLVGMMGNVFAYGGSNGTVAWSGAARFDTLTLNWTAETSIPSARLGAFFGAIDSAGTGNWGAHYACGNYDPGSSTHYRGYWVPTGMHAFSFAPTTNFKLTIVPNPVRLRRITAVRYSLPVAGPISFKLYNVAGAVVKTYTNTNPTKDGVMMLETKTLPSGVYILRFISEDIRVTRKLVLEK